MHGDLLRKLLEAVQLLQCRAQKRRVVLVRAGDDRAERNPVPVDVTLPQPTKSQSWRSHWASTPPRQTLVFHGAEVLPIAGARCVILLVSQRGKVAHRFP